MSQKDIRTEALFSALNDCNMRAYVNQFNYAAMVDFDEFIIPKSEGSLVDLIGLLVECIRDQIVQYFWQLTIHL